MTTPTKQLLSNKQALQKIRHYCAHQERCHLEVKEKLYSYGLHQKDPEALISQLIEENFLNEERFAIQYAGSKFRLNQWGKVKIKHMLNQKQVSEYCIKKALQQIDDDAYLQTLHKLGDLKWKMIRGEKNIFVNKHKLQNYLLQKGYEGKLIMNMLNVL